MILAPLLALAALSDVPPSVFEANQTILFQGDSITDGNRGRNADPNHILGHGYVFSIASRYGAAYPGLDLNFVNRGVSGNTLTDLAARWDADALALKPDVLSVLVGINDVYAFRDRLADFDAERSYAAYDALLARTVAVRPGIKLVLCEPFVGDVGMVAKDSAGWRRAVGALDAVVARLGAKYHAPVVPLQRVFDDAAKRAPVDHWIWDGIHPTYSGHALLADAWIRAYNESYVSPLRDPARNSAIVPEVNRERDSYDWLHRHDDALDAPRNPRPDLVLVGDSITHFWGGEPKATQANGPKSYAEAFKGLRVLNLGFGWDRTQNVLWRLEHGELDGLNPRAIVLNIGTNNLVGDRTARTNTPEETAVGIESVVDALRARSPESRIVVMGVFPRGFERGNDLDRRITALNGLVRKAIVGRANVEFLDIGPELREADGSVSRGRFSDGTHPTEEGYAIWGAALRRAGLLKPAS